jgi:hypothetical protein
MVRRLALRMRLRWLDVAGPRAVTGLRDRVGVGGTMEMGHRARNER